MGLLTFVMNVTLDGCVDHQVGVVNGETHAFFTGLLERSDGILWGRVTYEMMESYWPRVASGELDAPSASKAWATTLETKAKYVASTTRRDFPWTNSAQILGDLRSGVQGLKDRSPNGMLIASAKLGAVLDAMDLIDDYRLLLQPRLAGHGPTLYEGGLPQVRNLDLISASPLGDGVVSMHYRRA